MSLPPGTKIGPYVIQEHLASGGMGEVYRARDPRLGRDVAVKILPGAETPGATLLRRFEQEARATAALNHPNILTVFDVGTHEDTPFLVAELLAGETLAAIPREAPAKMEGAVPPPPSLSRLVLHCMEKEPAARFQTATDLAFALETVSGEERLR